MKRTSCFAFLGILVSPAAHAAGSPAGSASEWALGYVVLGAALCVVFAALVWETVQRRRLEERSLGLLELNDELVQSRERFHFLVQTAPSAIVCLSPENEIVEFNGEAERLFGVDCKDVLGSDDFEGLFPEEVRGRVARERRKVMEGTPAGDFECQIESSDGSTRSTVWKMDRLADWEGRPLGFIACGRDTTRRKETEAELEEYRDRLEELVEERTTELARANRDLEGHIVERERAEKERGRLLHDLGERVKELACMYGTSESIRTRSSLEDVFRDVAALIPPGWHYPEITRARIVFDDASFATDGFRETEWKQSSDIVVGGVKRGAVEVVYTEQRPELDEGPFLKEERNLIDALARALSEAVERDRAEEALRTTSSSLNSILASATEYAIAATDLDFRIVHYNPTAERLFGYTAEQVIGRTVQEMHTKESVASERFDRAIEAVLRDGKFDYDVESEAPDGSTRYVQSSVMPRKDENGEVTGFILISRDVTDRRRAEEELDEYKHRLEDIVVERTDELSQANERLQAEIQERKHSQQNYSILFNEMHDGFALHEILCDSNGVPMDYRFLSVNPAFERLMGLEAESIVGKTVLEVWPETEPHWIETFGRVALTGEPARLENDSSAAGRRFEVSAYSPTVGQFAAVYVDVTERKPV